jgi:hypothetical protein
MMFLSFCAAEKYPVMAWKFADAMDQPGSSYPP